MSHTVRRSHPVTSSRRRRDDGQVLVVFVISVVALILVAGLVVDAGNAFLNRRQGQNAADLAALAGTNSIASFYVTDGGSAAAAVTDGPKVYTAIVDRLAANGCGNPGGISCSFSASYVDGSKNVVGTVTSAGAIPTNTQGVIVNVTRQPPTFFLGVIGQSQWAIGTSATALTAKITSGPGGALLPIGINPPAATQDGTIFTLTGGSSYGPGNFGWLSWTGSNATGVLVSSLCNPDNPALAIGDVVPGDPGVTNSTNVRACLQQWIDSGATVLVPLFTNCSPCNGNNSQFTVSGFAAFVLTSYSTSGGAINTLQGYFVGITDYTSVPAGSGSGPPPPGAGDTTIQLGLVN